MKRMEKSKLKYSPSIERAFLNDEISKNQAKLKKLKLKLSEIWPAICKFLSFFDWIRFSRYLADIEKTQQDRIQAKHFRNLNWLLKQRFGSIPSNFGDNIYNLSSYELSDTEKFVLAYGLDFCLPPFTIHREIFARPILAPLYLGARGHMSPLPAYATPLPPMPCDYCYFLDFGLFRIWTLCLRNLELGFGFGLKIMVWVGLGFQNVKS